MTSQTVANQTYCQINKLINSSRFNEAFGMLKSRMKNFKSLNKELNNIKDSESTYRYLLDYLISGNLDPSRQEVMDQIRDSLFHANELLLREYRLIDSSDLYSSIRRIELLRGNTFQFHLDTFMQSFKEDNPEGIIIESPVVSKVQSEKLDELFNYVMTMTGAPSDEYEQLLNSFIDAQLPEYAKLSLTSAIILGSIEFFDPDFFDILLSTYENSDSPYIQARTVTGIVLLSLLHSHRLKGNINLRSRLMISMEDNSFKKMVREVLMGIIRTYDTQRIDNKMRNEVIPGLMKIQPEIIDKLRNLSSDSENFLSDINPDWEDMLDKSGIGDKLREINDMQLEGADVMVTAFSNLKSFPFFERASNWFLPFLPRHFEFSNLPLNHQDDIVGRLTTVMCDSDLNSFLLSVKSMPQDRGNQMIANIESQMKQAQEALTNAIGETSADIFSKKVRQSLQDLYRFFKFFKKKGDFKDPFGTPFLSSHIRPLISTLGIDVDDLKVVAEFYFRKKYYQESAGMFELIDEIQSDDFTNWEKIGYCNDRLKNYDEAIRWYKKAEIVDPGKIWLIKKLAVALKNSGRPKEALEYYEKVLEIEPDNYHILMSLAQCLIDLEEYEKALHYLYHAQYLKPEKNIPTQALAWTELLAGNSDKAEKLYQKLLDQEEKDKNDLLNMGHCAMKRKDFKSAVAFYKQYLDASDTKDIKSLVIAFRDDAESLKRLGIPTEDLRLVIDKIRYDSMETS
ncbi:MAG: tetratricopeptide repeat protein [Muribaculaceae bacterium]|nr:tetratricopeptide repeat protein [Muribaculaceae bacterium]